MFLMNCCQSLTIHQFTEPPSVVLDLGCGGGYWAIEAAKQWKVRHHLHLLFFFFMAGIGQHDSWIRSQEDAT